MINHHQNSFYSFSVNMEISISISIISISISLDFLYARDLGGLL